MAIPAGAVADVVGSATANAAVVERANQEAASRDAGAGDSSGFDVWSHTASALPDRAAESPEGTDRALAEGVTGDWSAADGGDVADSVGAQASAAWKEFQVMTGQQEPSDGGANPDGVMTNVGATFGLLTSLEQMISAPLAMLPFPAFPAIRVTDMDVGLPHAHSHPPNLVPPAPPVPFPSTGPIIPIPFLSGATRTLINGMPAARCGDMGLGIWCGGYFPMYEVFLGSSSVWIEGARAGRLLVDITRHCIFSAPKPQDPPLGPMVGMTITSSPNVLIGGVPMPSLLDLAMGAAIQALCKGIGKAVKAAKSLRAARKADDVAATALRNSSSTTQVLRRRPSHAENMERLLDLCGGDVGEAVRRWADARKVVDDLLDRKVIQIRDGNEVFEKAVKEDLYLMASTQTGRRQLDRVAAQPYDVTIRPLSHCPDPNCGASAWPRKARYDQATGELAGDAYFDTGKMERGLGEGSDIYYDPTMNTGSQGRTPPDVTLNHEMGHAANAAEGNNMANAPASPSSGGRFPHLEEERVIKEVDNPYRREFGMGERTGWGHLE